MNHKVSPQIQSLIKTWYRKLKAVAVEDGVNQTELAGKAKMQRPQLNRVLNGHENTHIDAFAKLCEALDLEVVFKKKEKQ